MTIAVLTCIVNWFDYLRPPALIDPSVRYVCFSDRPIERVTPWEIQPAYCPLTVTQKDGAPHPNNSRNSRLPKMLPHLHVNADFSIWHDANFVLRVKPQDLINRYLARRDIAMFAHPCRKHVGEEVAVLLREKIGDPAEVKAQQTDWLNMGAPLGLWAGGLIVRRHTPQIQKLNETWWHYFKIGSTRDQVSLAMARHMTGVEIETIPGDIFSSPIMGFHWHAAWRDKGTNPEYHTQEAEFAMRRKRLEELAHGS